MIRIVNMLVNIVSSIKTLHVKQKYLMINEMCISKIFITKLVFLMILLIQVKKTSIFRS